MPQNIAMTGEVTIRGRVLPIGGLREKTMAAYRAKMKNVIVPKENEPDISEIDPIVAKGLRVRVCRAHGRCAGSGAGHPHRLSRNAPGWCLRPQRTASLPALQLSTGEGQLMNFSKAEFIRSAAFRPRTSRGTGCRGCCLQGRSNVGKSSTINTLLQRKNFARVSAVAGQDRICQLVSASTKGFWFVDLPGYGYARVSQREKERFSQPDRGIHERQTGTMWAGPISIVDARHKPTADDQLMAEWFRANGVPMAVIANKVDKLKKSRDRAQSGAHPPGAGAGGGGTCCSPFPPKKGPGRDEVRRDIMGAGGP